METGLDYLAPLTSLAVGGAAQFNAGWKDLELGSPQCREKRKNSMSDVIGWLGKIAFWPPFGSGRSVVCGEGLSVLKFTGGKRIDHDVILDARSTDCRSACPSL